MSRSTQWRAVRTALLTLVTLTAACRDASAPTTPGVLRPNPAAAMATTRVKDSVPDGNDIGTLATANALPRTRYRAEYHNGIIKTGTSTVYFIWYGTWGGQAGSPAQQILGELVASLGGSAYFQVSRLYPEGSGLAPSGGLVYSGAIYDSIYSHGAVLTPTDVSDIVTQNILDGKLPLDLHGIYLVLASAGVSTPGYAASLCAFHREVTVVGTRLPYALVIDPARAPSSCAPQMLGPNGTLGADAMASLVAAEMFDIVTDGYLDGPLGYYDRLGLEPASKCAWTYGTTYKAPNGALANVSVGGRDFLLQQLWVPSKSGGACAMHP